MQTLIANEWRELDQMFNGRVQSPKNQSTKPRFQVRDQVNAFDRNAGFPI